MDQKVLKNLVYKTMTGYFNEDVETYFNDMGLFLEDNLDLDQKILDEVNDIFEKLL